MKAFGVFLTTLGICLALSCGFGILCYTMEAAILETGLCIFGTAVGAGIACAGSELVD